MKWRDKLTKKELQHLKDVAGVSTLKQFRNTLKMQRAWDKESGLESCWECRLIAKKLDL